MFAVHAHPIGEKEHIVIPDFTSSCPWRLTRSETSMPYNTQKPWLYTLWLTVQCTHAGRIVLSTIPENDSILKGLLGVTPQKFKPSIPHLVRLLVMSCQTAYHACSMALLVPTDLWSVTDEYWILQVYQYHIYTNYSSVLLSQPNPEIVADV